MDKSLLEVIKDV